MNRPAQLTLVTVCRNSRRTIRATIESVLMQKVSDIEYIVVDGASTDGTPEIVRSFGSGVDVFVSEPDNGIAEAFNKGIRLASGQVIGLINSDDCLAPDSLAKVLRFFEANPDTEVLHGDVILLEGDRRVKRIKPAGRWWYPWRFVLFNHPATFVKREVYEKHGMFDETFRIAMDVDIFLRWMSKGVKIEYLPEVLALMQASGISGQRAVEGYREVRSALRHHGFSPLLANIQCWGKVAVWAALETVQWCVGKK